MDNYCATHSCSNPNVKRLPRSQMPQFTRSSLKKMDKRMKHRGHTAKKSLMSPLKMKPSQTEISVSTANSILEKWGGKIKHHARKDPIIVSKDGSILDGHHRYLALLFAIKAGKLPQSYKAPVHMYSSEGRETLKIAKTLKTPRHLLRFHPTQK